MCRCPTLACLAPACLVLACLALGAVPAGAADSPGQAAAAEHKAEVLEEKASAQGEQAPPAPAQTITPSEAQAVDPSGQKPLDDALTCLARTVYWEAKGEGERSMEAIANVVMNRLGHAGFPNTVCGVVKQGQAERSCQFSWWCDGRPDDVEEEGPYARAKEIARQALNQQLPDRTHGALYFHHKGAAPDWAKEYRKTAEVGEHVFYKPPNGEAR